MSLETAFHARNLTPRGEVIISATPRGGPSVAGEAYGKFTHARGNPRAFERRPECLVPREASPVPAADVIRAR